MAVASRHTTHSYPRVCCASDTGRCGSGCAGCAPECASRISLRQRRHDGTGSSSSSRLTPSAAEAGSSKQAEPLQCQRCECGAACTKLEPLGQPAPPELLHNFVKCGTAGRGLIPAPPAGAAAGGGHADTSAAVPGGFEACCQRVPACIACAEQRIHCNAATANPKGHSLHEGNVGIQACKAGGVRPWQLVTGGHMWTLASADARVQLQHDKGAHHSIFICWQ